MYLTKLWLIVIFLLSHLCFVSSGAIQITSSNIDEILSSNEVVFLNFYANWCRFSQMLNPIYDEFADRVAKEFPGSGVVGIGKIDCDSQSSISIKYHVNKYPTLKLFRHGLMVKREYRGARQIENLVDFIRKQVQSAVINLTKSTDLIELNEKQSFIIGHFDDEKSENYLTFVKVANLLRDECHFAGSTNKDEFVNERGSNDLVYYRSDQKTNKKENISIELVNNAERLYNWCHNKCFPVVREITFENAEELTEEGLPFLILFHHIDDQQSLTQFQDQILKQLVHQQSMINCLHADGHKFVHPLQHLGKSTKDLPLLVIDSFRHMFLFEHFQQISIDGKLLQFVNDFHSEKLHRDFHNPTTLTNVPGKKKSANDFSAPPESVFVRLTPSRQRYSFRDEL